MFLSCPPFLLLLLPTPSPPPPSGVSWVEAGGGGTTTYIKKSIKMKWSEHCYTDYLKYVVMVLMNKHLISRLKVRTQDSAFFFLFKTLFLSCPHPFSYRPNALTSHLHNNDAMLGGQDLSRCAHVLCWKSVGSHSVRRPRPARRYGMQGLARWLHAWRWRTRQCLVWPPTGGGALLWRHMHKVYYLYTTLPVSCVKESISLWTYLVWPTKDSTRVSSKLEFTSTFKGQIPAQHQALLRKTFHNSGFKSHYNNTLL